MTAPLLLTDAELDAALYAMQHLHEPAALPLRDMPVMVAAHNKLAAARQARKAQAEMAAFAKRMGAVPVKASEAPPSTNGHAEAPPDLHVVESPTPEANS